nr:MAG TPA: hypothetical protein [Bacteriophage sp.]
MLVLCAYGGIFINFYYFVALKKGLPCKQPQSAYLRRPIPV